MILYSSFGDLALALPALQSLRQHHKNAHLVFLTREPLRQAIVPFNIFDEFILDQQQRLFFRNHKYALALLRKIESHKFTHIYDLHNNHRAKTHLLLLSLRRILRLRLFGKPKVYAFPRARLPLYRPIRNPWQVHVTTALHEWLSAHGVKSSPTPHTNSLTLPPIPPEIAKEIAQELSQESRFALLVAGGSMTRSVSSNRWPPTPAKIWPARNYATLAQQLAQHGVRPVLIGTEIDRAIVSVIAERTPQALNLLGKTDLPTLLALGQKATVVIANDCGPAHWLAIAGAPIVSLFGKSPPASVWRPQGVQVVVLEHEPLADLAPDVVWRAVEPILNQ